MNFAPHAFDPAAFLRDTWQQKPLLIRQAWRDWANPLEPDELAGLACEEGVEARLVTGGTGTWALENGPFAETRFAQLGDKDWTLLVQAVDHQVPDVAALIAPFRFIPDWRIDDVMVSYAAQGGGVGPHFDQYDVFLVQGMGRRRWRIGQHCDDRAALLPHADLKLLADFVVTDEWVLEPGDILYVPPGFAHDGVAVDGDCMTYSIGFRAPSRHELIGLWVDEILSGLADDDRYADPGLVPQENPGEIKPAALEQLQAMVAETLLDRTAFANWFGRHTSARKYPEVDWQPEQAATPETIRAILNEGAAVLERNPAYRFAFIAQGPDAVTLFVDGQSYTCVGPVADFARQLCANSSFECDPAPADAGDAVALIVALYNAGSIAFADEDEDEDDSED
jgi:50S ribosomal protein L16 3-hydroxylase